jgi:hypothetical protein
MSDTLSHFFETKAATDLTLSTMSGHKVEAHQVIGIDVMTFKRFSPEKFGVKIGVCCRSFYKSQTRALGNANGPNLWSV